MGKVVCGVGLVGGFLFAGGWVGFVGLVWVFVVLGFVVVV